MQISEKQRAIIESALDTLGLAIDMWSAPLRRQYEQAIAIVRERPANTRKVRSDAGTKRSKGE